MAMKKHFLILCKTFLIFFHLEKTFSNTYMLILIYCNILTTGYISGRPGLDWGRGQWSIHGPQAGREELNGTWSFRRLRLLCEGRGMGKDQRPFPNPLFAPPPKGEHRMIDGEWGALTRFRAPHRNPPS